jgi:tetratricopeptide (TPR) repeat protein
LIAVAESYPDLKASQSFLDLQHNLSQAEEYYRQAIDSNPQFAQARLGLARLYRERGKIDEALKILEKLFVQQQQQQGAVRQQT